MRTWGVPEHEGSCNAETPLFPAGGATAHAVADLASESYGTFNAVQVHNDEAWRARSDSQSIESNAPPEKIFTKPVIMFVVALGIFTYHSVSQRPDTNFHILQ